MAKRVGVLHVITDVELQSRFSHEELAALAAWGGADTIQLRDKGTHPIVWWVRTAKAVAREARRAGAQALVNDRVDVALRAGVAHVHLGRHDVAPETARALLGDAGLIGVTANGVEEALRRARGPVDYLGVGPVFETRSKQGAAPALGLESLRRIVSAVQLPVIAIGAITPERVEEVLATGAHGIAVLSAVACAKDPLTAAQRFREAIGRFGRERRLAQHGQRIV